MADGQIQIVTSKGYFRPEEDATDTVHIPDGKWVLTTMWRRRGHHSMIIGTEESAVTTHTLRYTWVRPRRRSWTQGTPDFATWETERHELLVCNQPFGTVINSGVIVARQIVDGKVGGKPEIDKPRFVKERPAGRSQRLVSINGTPAWITAGKRIRRGWARVDEVATLAGMTPSEMMAHFFPFAEWSGETVCTLVTDDESQIRRRNQDHWVPEGPQVEHVSFESSEMTRFAETPEQVWIRQGFANAILHMRNLGYTPPKHRVYEGPEDDWMGDDELFVDAATHVVLM